ncbi:MAG: beta propeller repeat protein [Gaiellaceae bacterium]
MNVLVHTEAGAFEVDLDSEEIEPSLLDVPEPNRPQLNLPRVVAAAATGSTVVAVVDRKPPLVVSHDAGATWREAGGGLPAGFAVALSDDDPDVIVYASRNRLHVSTNGGVFWRALALELPAIERVTIL